jgi:hypothetical protein
MPEGVDEDAEEDPLLEDVVINQIRQAQPGQTVMVSRWFFGGSLVVP